MMKKSLFWILCLSVAVVTEAKLFGACWIGTETRDANPDPLQACWIIDWMDRITEGRCGGGWYDPLKIAHPSKFVEQARYTILGGARESLLHCYDYLLADDPGKAGDVAERSRAEGRDRLVDLRRRGL